MKPYCKTPTAIYYEPGDGTTAKVKSWGWETVRARMQDIDKIEKLRAKLAVELPEFGTFCWEFKPGLAPNKSFPVTLSIERNCVTTMKKVPEGFTVTQVIADYVREICASIMRHLRTKFSDNITMADIQWCVTVPSSWGDHAKKEMQVCMARAGLVRSANSPEGSPHPVSIVLESEAASCYCHHNMPDLEPKVGDQLLVVDIGWATTDIVVQEWMGGTPDDYRVKLQDINFTALPRGGMSLDYNFFWKSLDDEKFVDKLFIVDAVDSESGMGTWEMFKQWEAYNQLEEIKCSFGDMVSKAIFDSFVDQILYLIGLQISRTANVKVILVVGGFGGSPYLLTKIQERFLGTVEKVMSPVQQPGSAVCQGAVMLALNPGSL